MLRATEAATSLFASSNRMFEMGLMRSHDRFDDLGRGPEDESWAHTSVAAEGSGARLPLTRRRLLGGASAGAVAIGTAPSWLAGCVTPQEEPWADGTFWADGTGWIDDSAWL